MASIIVTSLAAAGILAGSLADPLTDPLIVPQGFVSETAPVPDAKVQPVRGDCAAAAAQAVAMTGGELLSVAPARNGRPFCQVVVLVINKNGRPRRIRLRIPMDL
ncbi:MAG: hypothetical protein RLZZ444_1680 [Pseudomonadota bacterium]|jgi:hypothetical protein